MLSKRTPLLSNLPLRKKLPTDSIVNTQLGFRDFMKDEVETHFELAALDPGRTHVFAAAFGPRNHSHQVRRCFSAEYYNMTGSSQRNRLLQKEKVQRGIDKIEAEMPTAKTCRIEKFHEYASYLLRYFSTLTDFYNAARGETRFHNYQRTQRAKEEMTSILLNGGKKYDQTKRKNLRKNRKLRRHNRNGQKSKRLEEEWIRAYNSEPMEEYNSRIYAARTVIKNWKPAKFEKTDKMPMIVFGSAMFNKDLTPIRGKRAGVVNKLWKTIKRREKLGKVGAITVNEYHTSQVCQKCKARNMKKVKTADEISHHGIMECKACKILWQRDVNASKNMFDIATSMWTTDDQSSPFQRPARPSARNRHYEYGFPSCWVD